MAITRKPSAAAAKPNIDELINRGGSSPRTEQGGETSEPESIAVILRIPAKMLSDIDRSVKARKIRTPRHTWLLEAILEKLGREKAATTTDDI